jgi:hypothetical protein
VIPRPGFSGQPGIPAQPGQGAFNRQPNPPGFPGSQDQPGEIAPVPGAPVFPGVNDNPGMNPSGIVQPPQNDPHLPKPENDNPAFDQPRFQQPVLEQIWTCSRCGGVIGRGPDRPSVYSCPNCGARLSGQWTLVGTLIGGLVVGLIFLFKVLFNRS